MSSVYLMARKIGGKKEMATQGTSEQSDQIKSLMKPYYPPHKEVVCRHQTDLRGKLTSILCVLFCVL